MPEKEEFAKYVSAHTVIGYDSAANIYEFCKALNLTKEEIVNEYGSPESLSILTVGRIVWERYKHDKTSN